MEKYARQAIAEGVKNAEDLTITTESELYRVLNLHYNRNNQIEVRMSKHLKIFSLLIMIETTQQRSVYCLQLHSGVTQE